jgi:hypothetical protein
MPHNSKTMSSIADIPLRDWLIENGVTRISKIKLSRENQYPFITFYSPNFESGTMSIWLSKNAGQFVFFGQSLERLGLDQYSIRETENAEGQKRLKLMCTPQKAISKFSRASSKKWTY